jgi:hypothetical protein
VVLRSRLDELKLNRRTSPPIRHLRNLSLLATLITLVARNLAPDELRPMLSIYILSSKSQSSAVVEFNVQRKDRPALFVFALLGLTVPWGGRCGVLLGTTCAGRRHSSTGWVLRVSAQAAAYPLSFSSFPFSSQDQDDIRLRLYYVEYTAAYT